MCSLGKSQKSWPLFSWLWFQLFMSPSGNTTAIYPGLEQDEKHSENFTILQEHLLRSLKWQLLHNWYCSGQSCWWIFYLLTINLRRNGVELEKLQLPLPCPSIPGLDTMMICILGTKALKLGKPQQKVSMLHWTWEGKGWSSSHLLRSAHLWFLGCRTKGRSICRSCQKTVFQM